MANLTIRKAEAGAKLLKALLKKADNGDGQLAASELKRADNSRGSGWGGRGTSPQDQWTVDLVTHNALLAAVNRSTARSDQTLTNANGGIDAALKEIKAADVDRSGSLSDTEVKKVRTALGKALMEFARLHGAKSPASFKFKSGPAPFVPNSPFKAPANATAATYIEALVTHFNAYANDNAAPGGRRPDSTTRWVLDTAEAKSVAAELAKLPAAKAKTMLRELAKRIHMADASGFRPRRIYVMPRAQAPFDALAKKLHVSLSFDGVAAAPYMSFY